jgi:hypothetical protein
MDFEFWVKYLKVVSLFFAVLGLWWAYSGTFDPFGIYDYYFAKTFWNLEQLPSDVDLAKRFILGPFGATSAGYFMIQYFVIKHAFAKKEIWAYYAIVYGFLIWCFNDCAITVYHGAYFNLVLANLPSVLLMSPIFFLKKYFKSPN